MDQFLSGLNVPQQQAVMQIEGPVLILAGAGSGKTKALTHRIAYMVDQKGINPWNILAITFTNKAAQEMKERVEALTERGAGVNISTFHAACGRILRSKAMLLGYNQDFVIYDSQDQQTLMKHILKEGDYDSRIYKEKTQLAKISSLKNELVDVEQFCRQIACGYEERRFGEIYREYQRRLMQANAMDFDDMLVNVVKLFEENPDVLEEYRNRFRYILVDEYQDTNHAQFRMIELLAGARKNLCVVGDDDQSIYRFRGADIRNILDFEKAFPGCMTVRLEQSYRSTNNILRAANEVIKNNTDRKAKTLWSEKPDGDKVCFRQYETWKDEAEALASDLKAHRDQYPFGDCAVLYRTNSQSRVLEENLSDAGIAFQLIGGISFYQRKEIKDMVAYLKTIANGRDDVACRRIINEPRRGIGETTVGKVAEYAADNQMTFCAAMDEVIESGSLKKAGEKLAVFRNLIEDLREDAGKMKVKDLITAVMKKTGMEAELIAENTTESETRLENLYELKSKAAEYDDYEGEYKALNLFLEEIALISDIDNLSDDEERVTLMTLHGSKGLEFRKVYIVGMEQGLFPGARRLHSEGKEDLEEERRLCYVGFTRAKEKLILSAARCRYLNGETQYHDISQFVQEIPDELLTVEGRGRMRTPEETRRREAQSFGWQDFGDSFGYGSARRGSFGNNSVDISAYLNSPAKPVEEDTQRFAPGERVKTKRFGEGTVVTSYMGQKSLMVTVNFDRFGQKTLSPTFAGLEKCN